MSIYNSQVQAVTIANQGLQGSYERLYSAWESATAKDRAEKDRCMAFYKNTYERYEQHFGEKPNYTDWGPCKTYWRRLAGHPEPQEPQYLDVPERPSPVDFNCSEMCNAIY